MRNWFDRLGATVRYTSPNFKLACLGSNVGETTIEITPSGVSQKQLLWLFVLLGVLTRAVRYYLCFPLWTDESFLCVNFINRTYAELLQPLDYHQVAPVLFLWIERMAVQLFGFSENALRLFPFVCSIASVFLFRRLTERLLTGPALLFAVGIFAVSYPGIRYSAEAKPYGSDLFVSLAMLCLVVEWLQCRARKQVTKDIYQGSLEVDDSIESGVSSASDRSLWYLTLLMPLALGLSYPAVFTAGGLSLVVGWTLWWRSGLRCEWHAWFAWNLTLVASFVFWFWLVGHVQNAAEAEFMGSFWKQNFPPIREPWQLPLWLLKTHASDFLAYPLGGPNWASTLTLAYCVAGLWRLAQRRQFAWLGLLLGPAGLHLLAAALERYPYGGHFKFSQYLAPMICCLTAVGIVQALDWWTRLGHSAKRGAAWSFIVLAVIGCGAIARDLALPYKTRTEFRARAFAQAFWFGVHHSEEVLCLKSDLGLDFSPDQHLELSSSARYYCNRAIEVSRSRLSSANFNRVSCERPLRCVIFRDPEFKFDQVAFDCWLHDMQHNYVLAAHESLPFPRFSQNNTRFAGMEYIDSYKFIPRENVPDTPTNQPLANRRASSQY